VTAGHPFGYLPQEIVEQHGDEDTLRMVREYDPAWEMVTVFLKTHDRTSSYRLGVISREPKEWEVGVVLPARNIEQTERLLQEGVITPTKFVEEDDTSHQVLKFDPTPVGCSGFDNCVIHSLAQTDRGLFEVGRYPAMDLESQTKAWQWFIHGEITQPNA
jgi:hypothetical protein